MSGSGQCAGRLVFWLMTMSVAVLTSASVVRRSNRLLDKQQQIRPSSSDWDTAGLPGRRITPKSVFVAPSFSGCSDGYRQDGMGRCVKLVKVNQAAQLDFLLQKLNSKFAAPMADAVKPVKAELEAGPFRVSIPIGGDIRPSDGADRQESTTIVAATTGVFDEDNLSTETTSTTRKTNSTAVQLSASNGGPHRRRNPPNAHTGKPFVIVVAPTTLPTTTSLSDDHAHITATPLPETFTTISPDTTTFIPTAAATSTSEETTSPPYAHHHLHNPSPDITTTTWTDTTSEALPTTFLHSETTPGSTEYYSQPSATTEDHQTVPTTSVDLESAVEDESVDEDRFSTTSSVVATGNFDAEQQIVIEGDTTEGVLEDPFRAAMEPQENQSTDCETWPATQEQEGVPGCRPLRVVTTSSSSFFIRFPTESVSFRPPVSYSSSDNNRPKNGFIRFPSISSPQRAPAQTSSYGASRPWTNDASTGDGVSMASSSSVFASWFPFLQQQQPPRHWMDRYNNYQKQQQQQQHMLDYYGDADGVDYHRKQHRYHRRPAETTSSHVLPAWFDKHIISWPQSSE